MIYVITGLSGSGKTTIAKEVSKKTNLPLVVTTTTRPMRPGEKNGIDYWFLSDEDYNTLKDAENIIAHESFNVAGGYIWNYGIRKEDLNNDCILVLTPTGVNELKEKTNDAVIDIMINTDDDIRMHRIIDRNDNQSPEEIQRRDIEDKAIFSNYRPALMVSNNNSVYDSINCVTALINYLQNKKNMI